MLMNQYFQKVNKLMEKIRNTQTENIRKAAAIIVESIEQGGTVHIFDTGHLINSEMVGRAGGLMLMKALNYHFNVDNKYKERDNRGKNTSLEGLAGYVLLLQCNPQMF